MQELKLFPISWSDSGELYGTTPSAMQDKTSALLLKAEAPELGFAVYWHLAPKDHYLFFTPEYKINRQWMRLRKWHQEFFQSSKVEEVKRFARKKKWAIRKSPILSQMQLETVSDFGADFDGWNEVVAVNEFVLPLEKTSEQKLLSHLREWENVFERYAYKIRPQTSPVVLNANEELTLALHSIPMTADPTKQIEVAQKCFAVLAEMLSQKVDAEFLLKTHLAESFPALIRFDMVKSFQMTEEEKLAWGKVYELRVQCIEKFSFPWFYEGTLAMIGAQTAYQSLTASEIVEQGVPSPSKPMCPVPFVPRLSEAVLKIEKAHPILKREIF